MRFAARACAWVGLLLLAGVGGARAADGDTAALQDLLASPALRGARVGLAVEDLQTGERLLARNPERGMVPASNQKVLVAAAALARWGPAHRFETPVYVDGELDPYGVLHGTLWIEGRGDPGLVSESMWKLAEEIALRGIRDIRGGIAVDVSYFDGQRLHPDWEPVSSRAYHAPTSAFAANYSSFRIEVQAGAEEGDPVAVRVAPAIEYFDVRPEAVTLDRRGSLVVERAPLAAGRGELVSVRGSLPLSDESRTFWRSVTLPEHYAISVLRAHLRAQGVRVSGPARLGTLPPGARELLRFRGERVDTLVFRLNKFSNNFIAEQLTKLLGVDAYGPPATWEKGSRYLREYLVSLGIDDRGVVIADGSGLSPRNRLSPAVLVQLIREASQSFAFGPEFLASLPLGGRDGTLEDRMNGEPLPLRGKTGHLRSVSSLSGVLPGAGGRMLGFSLLVNGARGNSRDVDAAMDQFVAALHLATRDGPPDGLPRDGEALSDGSAAPGPSSPE